MGFSDRPKRDLQLGMEELGRSLGGRLETFVASIGSILANDAQRESFAAYVLGLLSDGERKSMEPIAARVCPDPERVDATHQKLQHFISNAKWSDREIRRYAASYAVAEMVKRGPIRAWIIDDTGMLKQGRHSVGVQRQYTGSAGKIANCQIAATLSVSTLTEHVPVDIELYLPESWTKDRARRKKAKIPKEMKFKTKTEIAIEMLQRAIDDDIPRGVLLADAFYGRSGDFRTRARELGLEFIVAIDSDTLLHPVVDGRFVAKEAHSSGQICTRTRSSNRHLARGFEKSPLRTIRIRPGQNRQGWGDIHFHIRRAKRRRETKILPCGTATTDAENTNHTATKRTLEDRTRLPRSQRRTRIRSLRGTHVSRMATPRLGCPLLFWVSRGGTLPRFFPLGRMLAFPPLVPAADPNATFKIRSSRFVSCWRSRLRHGFNAARAVITRIDARHRFSISARIMIA